MDPNQPVGENYANPRTCFFHVLFKAAALAFYILSALFIDNFVIIFVVTVLLAALDFWVVKNVSGRILVGLRWWNEINDLGESVWKFECLDHESLARMNKKDSWLFWWTLYLTAVLWILLAIFSLIRLQADYLLVVGVCLTLSIANIMPRSRFNNLPLRQLPLGSHLPYSQHSVLSDRQRWKCKLNCSIIEMQWKFVHDYFGQHRIGFIKLA
ncbi:Golgi apparatus membrane protein-like protein ECHIDNA [Glycine soja]